MSRNNYLMSDLYIGSFILWLAVETYGINMSFKCNYVCNSQKMYQPVEAAKQAVQ